jgi:ketosteroid isomerase-like protein
MPEESATTALVELAQRTVDATNAGDLDALLSLYSPDAAWDSGDPDWAGERFEGREAIGAFIREWWGAIEGMQMEATEICSLGSGVILAHLVQRGRPHGSAVSIEFRFATVSIWVSGLIREIWAFGQIDKARRAAVSLAKERA